MSTGSRTVAFVIRARIAVVGTTRPGDDVTGIDGVVTDIGALCSVHAGVARVLDAGSALTRVRPVAEQTVIACGAVRIACQAVVGRLAARLCTERVTVGTVARIPRVAGAGTVQARIGAVAEETVVAGNAVRHPTIAHCLAAYSATGAARRARIPGMDDACTRKASVGTVAEQAVVARGAIAIRGLAGVRSLIARFDAVAIAVGAGTGIPRMSRAAPG
jgi:hypothetical protein